MYADKTEHQRMVEEFMLRAGQTVPTQPTIATVDVRKLRACLILEEALETINKGLGIDVILDDRLVEIDTVEFDINGGVNLPEIADGVCDSKVVLTGTLSAFGIADAHLQRIVDESNLRKFGPGSSKRTDGKWLKPKGWIGPTAELAKHINSLIPKTIHNHVEIVGD